MNFLSWIVFGLIAGWLAKLIHPGKDPGGCLPTLIIGAVGSAVGGWLGSKLFGLDISGFNFKSFLIAAAGGLLVLIIYRSLK